MDPLDRTSANVVAYEGGSFRDRTPGKGIYTVMPMCGLRRLAQRYEYGKLKYGRSEAYKDGLPVSDCIDSMFRHLVEYLAGDNSEDHMAAIAWGAMAVMYMEEEHSYWQDVDVRKSLSRNNGDFRYLERVIERGEFK